MCSRLFMSHDSFVVDKRKVVAFSIREKESTIMSTEQYPELRSSNEDSFEPDQTQHMPFSRRGFGKHLILSASALAVLLATGKRDEVLAAPTTDPWRLGGNSISTNGTNFLGTTNVAPLIFKVTKTAGLAPTERMRITPGGTIGIGTTVPGGLLHAKLSSVAPAIIGESLSTAAGATGVLGKLSTTSG
jgi:hypothetical protein